MSPISQSRICRFALVLDEQNNEWMQKNFILFILHDCMCFSMGCEWALYCFALYFRQCALLVHKSRPLAMLLCHIFYCLSLAIDADRFENRKCWTTSVYTVSRMRATEFRSIIAVITVVHAPVIVLFQFYDHLFQPYKLLTVCACEGVCCVYGKQVTYSTFLLKFIFITCLGSVIINFLVFTA